jgi:hypothetical protein
MAGGSVFGQDTPAAKIAKVLNESKLTFTKVSDTVWTVPFEGKNIKEIPVVVSASEDVLVIFALVAQKKDINVTPALMQRLLRANEEFDRVKIGIDKEGDIFARIDISIRVLDAAELKANLQQTSAAADEVFAFVQPSLIKKK